MSATVATDKKIFLTALVYHESDLDGDDELLRRALLNEVYCFVA